MSNSSLIILSTNIRRDAEGRYCLNDCWAAAGKPEGKKPSNWNDLLGTKELVQELRQSGNLTFGSFPPLSVKKGGNAPGIFACQELVLAYAQWISPSFHVQCLRALLGMMKDVPAPQPEKAVQFQPFDPSNAIAFGLSFFPNLGEPAKQAFVAHTFEAALGRPVLPAPIVRENLLSATQVGQRLGLSANMVGRLANTYGLKEPRYGEFRLTTTRGGGKHVEQFHYNERGVAMLEKVK